MENPIVSLGGYTKGEEETFSIIEAYPYLSYEEGESVMRMTWQDYFRSH